MTQSNKTTKPLEGRMSHDEALSYIRRTIWKDAIKKREMSLNGKIIILDEGEAAFSTSRLMKITGWKKSRILPFLYMLKAKGIIKFDNYRGVKVISLIENNFELDDRI